MGQASKRKLKTNEKKTLKYKGGHAYSALDDASNLLSAELQNECVSTGLQTSHEVLSSATSDCIERLRSELATAGCDHRFLRGSPERLVVHDKPLQTSAPVPGQDVRLNVNDKYFPRWIACTSVTMSI
jgi:hypothetical protein